MQEISNTYTNTQTVLQSFYNKDSLLSQLKMINSETNNLISSNNLNLATSCNQSQPCKQIEESQMKQKHASSLSKTSPIAISVYDKGINLYVGNNDNTQMKSETTDEHPRPKPKQKISLQTMIAHKYTLTQLIQYQWIDEFLFDYEGSKYIQKLLMKNPSKSASMLIN